MTHSQSHYNRRDLADELRVRQLSLSRQKGRDNLTDMVGSRADAHYANPADQSESVSETKPKMPGAVPTNRRRPIPNNFGSGFGVFRPVQNF
jgi:hypothetical protein